MLTWGWARLAPEQRVAWLCLRRYDLLASLTVAQHRHILEAVLTPTERVAVANGLLAGLRPKPEPYVY
jgi:hypothetical protein